METPILKYEKDNLKLEVFPDLRDFNPRKEDDNLTVMLFMHGRYDIGDEHSYSPSDFTGWGDIERMICKKEDPVCLTPVYMFDHSGISFSTSDHYYPFNCPWDSGQVGYMYIPRKKLLKEFGRKKMSSSLEQKGWKILESELATYNAYVQGNFWYLKVSDNGETVRVLGGVEGGNDVSLRDVLPEEYQFLVNEQFKVI